MRIRRFLKFVWTGRSLCFQSPVVWRNLRAMWIQSDPEWFQKLTPLFDNDEEAEEFMKIIEDIS